MTRLFENAESHRGVPGTRGWVVAPLGRLGDPAPQGRYILVAQDLTPTDTAALDLALVAGFCTAEGGPTSHTVQVAHGLGIPAVVAAGTGILNLRPGTLCALDGDGGLLHAGLDGPDLQAATARERERGERDRLRREAALAAGPAPGGVTLSTTFVKPSQAEQLARSAASGIGLLATELLFLGREADITDEAAHHCAYRDLARTVGDAEITVRTLDIGGDKPVPALNLPKEDNSFLGVRGIRLALRRPDDLLIPQLRALYRVAAGGGRLRIMFPMVTTVEEFTRAAEIAEDVRARIRAPRVPLGVMVEVPACALAVDRFVEHVDFLSIGTNDLTQYLLAASRTNPALARDVDTLHVAVNRTIGHVTDTAHAAGVPVTACGSLAASPVGSAVLASLGISGLTVTLPALPAIHEALTRLDHDARQAIRHEALTTGGTSHLTEHVTALLGL
ncbi:putative PEP-binding protein [Streptomyces sp. NBC_01207]|uniref:putative PEP-binding protein n=1 Tax=Streptomyces sp. NBC_01207 TaxID=2903772 RepID=UPI002E112F8F|nr:PEP-utilizing enzyme [Streptomyces sp. NBC_01207]